MSGFWKGGVKDVDIENLAYEFKHHLENESKPNIEFMIGSILLDIGYLSKMDITKIFYPSWAPMIYSNLYLITGDKVYLNLLITLLVEYPSCIFLIGEKFKGISDALRSLPKGKGLLVFLHNYLISQDLVEVIDRLTLKYKML